MKAFKDQEGRSWHISVNVTTLKNIRDVLDIDLMQAINGEVITKLSEDPALLADVLYLTVKDQADKEGVSDENFGRALAGDVIDEAITAFLDELVAFFPKSKRRPMEKINQKVKTMEAAIINRVEAEIDSVDIEKEIENILMSGNSSTNSPGSSVSTPDPTP